MPTQGGTPESHVFYRKHKHIKPTIVRGEGITLWDADGRKYIDASGGAIVVNVGHGVESIARAMGDQAAQTAYAHATMFTTGPAEKLAARLATHLPVRDARLFFLTSGSEATEGAIKLARQVQVARGEQGRYKVVGRWGSYHGASLGALAVMGRTSMRAPFAPMFTDMPHIPPPYCYRCPFGLTPDVCGLDCADALEEEIEHQGAETVAAFIAEPISGAGLGAVVPPDGYWPRIREICDAYGVLLIADEVMSGMGRSGAWFAVQHWSIQPDILTMGKGISGGYVPLSAIAAAGDLVDLVYEKLGDFNHGGTFSHQPVAAAAGLATLDVLEGSDLVGRAATVGQVLGGALQVEFGDHPHVGDVRGRGMMWAIELVADRETRESFPAEAKLALRVFEEAFGDGLIIYATAGCVDGSAGVNVMVAPPFVVTETQISEIVTRLHGAVDRAIVAIT